MEKTILRFPQLELKLDKQQINSLVQDYLQQAYKREAIAERAMSLIQRKADKEVAKMINNGVLINRIASRVAKEIPLSDIVSLIDTDKLNEIVQKRVSDHLINKLWKKINIAELLKNCPRGMELDCVMFNNVTLLEVEEGAQFPISIKVGIDDTYLLTEYGEWNDGDINAKCIIFPKGKTTWEGFVPPCEFKEGGCGIL